MDVLSLNSSFWVSDHSYFIRPIDRIPASEQRRLLEIFDMSDRCQEELQYCIADVLTMIEYFRKYQKQLNDVMYSELASCGTRCYLSSETLDVYKYIGQYVSSVQLPRSSLERLSANIAKAEYSYYRLP